MSRVVEVPAEWAAGAVAHWVASHAEAPEVPEGGLPRLPRVEVGNLLALVQGVLGNRVAAPLVLPIPAMERKHGGRYDERYYLDLKRLAALVAFELGAHRDVEVYYLNVTEGGR